MTLAAIILADPIDALGDAPALYQFDDERTLIEWQIEQLAAAGVRDIEVVLGAGADEIIPLVTGDNVEAIVNPSPRNEESAVRTGAAAVPRGTSAALILRIDEPRPADVCRALIEGLDEGMSVLRPAFGGGPGTPIVVSGEVLEALRNVRTTGGIEAAIARFAAQQTSADARAPVLMPWTSGIVLVRLKGAGDLAAGRERFGL